MKINSIKSSAPFDNIRSILRAEETHDPEVPGIVTSIIRDVRENGDAAVLKYTAKFDNLDRSSIAELRISRDEMAAAADQLDPELLGALQRAADNILVFHQRQLERGFLDVFPDGSMLGQRVAPLARVGIYVPGGRASYPSSVLMNAVPARVAGVDHITMVCPAFEGTTDPAVIAAAHVAGVDEIIRIGGAQAVAALAYGTETIAPVDMICGPGNKWVAEGKRQVFGRVNIDMIAGPSEILVVADSTATARHVAADMIGQAEHDPDAIAWLVTDNADLAAAVPAALDELLQANPRRDIARASLENNGLIVVVDDIQAAAAVADLRAPEHLELLVAEPLQLAGRIRNAGAIFLGGYTPESVGDYYAGPNHILPTGGTARWASPLGVYDFVKRTSLLGYSRERLAAHGPDVIRLAESEHLFGHAEAVRVRTSI